jgi:hypothetical protein
MGTNFTGLFHQRLAPIHFSKRKTWVQISQGFSTKDLHQSIFLKEKHGYKFQKAFPPKTCTNPLF